MAKITRLAQLLFGADAFAANQIGVFGSLAAGTPTLAADASDIQDEPTRFAGGWYDAILGDSNPAIEDMNALFALAFRQLAYTLQTGVAEWDSATTYYSGSIATTATGIQYVSLVDTNVGNALTDRTKWLPVNGWDAVVGTGGGCSHANLAAVVADVQLSTVNGVNVLLTANETIAATLVPESAWYLKAIRPGITLTAGAASTCFTAQNPNMVFDGVRFSGFTTAIAFASGGDYGRVLNCNFHTCTNTVTFSGVTAGKYPLEVGNISEI